MLSNETNIPGPWEKIYLEKKVVQADAIFSVMKLAEILASENQASPKILDAGCGTGRHLLYLANFFRSGVFVGFDVAQTGLDILNNQWSNSGDVDGVRLLLFNLNMDHTVSPPVIGPFDAIISSLVIHHGTLKQIKKRLSDLDALLLPNSYIVLCIPSTDDPLYQTGYEMEPGTKLNTDQADGSLPHHYFHPEEIRSLLPNYETVFKHVSHPNLVASTIPGMATKLEFILKKIQ